MNVCECGCGSVVKEGQRFIRGHNTKGKRGPRLKKKSYELSYIIEIFESKIEVNSVNGCWVWNGFLSHEGYGGFSCCIEGSPKSYPAHRVSYMLYVGNIPEGLQVLHKCNNKRCVNPEHLYVGTHQDNMRDLREAGTLAGENNPNYGVPCSGERKIKISRGVKRWLRGNPDFDPSEYTSKTWIVRDPSGEELRIKNLTKFCRDNKLKLSSHYGLYIVNSGWTCRRLEENDG